MGRLIKRLCVVPLLAVALSATLFAGPAAASGGLTISTSPAPPTGTVGIGYSFTFSASGGTNNFTGWAVFSGSVPSGLQLNLTTGQLSGTPSAAGTFSFTVQVTDSGNNTATQAFSIVIAKGSTSVIPAATPSVSAQAQLVTYSAFVPGQGGVTPTGTVTFTSNPAGGLAGGVLCTGTLSSASASCSTNNTPNSNGSSPQSDTITATYSGDGNYNPPASAPTTSETVNAGTGTSSTTSVTPSSTTFGTTLTYSSTVSPQSGSAVPTGSVTFTTSSGSITLCNGTLDGTGKATCTSAAAPAGTDTVTATYNGAWNNSGSCSTSPTPSCGFNGS
ncbi:MAG TPA: Ig domain-containing protein, partial [Acidimicrobiales bacterium]